MKTDSEENLMSKCFPFSTLSLSLVFPSVRAARNDEYSL